MGIYGLTPVRSQTLCKELEYWFWWGWPISCAHCSFWTFSFRLAGQLVNCDSTTQIDQGKTFWGQICCRCLKGLLLCVCSSSTKKKTTLGRASSWFLHFLVRYFILEASHWIQLEPHHTKNNLGNQFFMSNSVSIAPQPRTVTGLQTYRWANFHVHSLSWNFNLVLCVLMSPSVLTIELVMTGNLDSGLSRLRTTCG